MKTVVSERGQITLPKAVRTALGIRAGTILNVAVVDGRITISKREEVDPVRAWRGKGTRPAGVSSTDEYLALVRD
jgi:AbrB family looped-hinge helix DNA binding protein